MAFIFVLTDVESGSVFVAHQPGLGQPTRLRVTAVRSRVTSSVTSAVRATNVLYRTPANRTRRLHFTMGFSTEAFIEPVDDELLCMICQDVFDAPVTACRELHTFCSGCLTDVRNSMNSRCPSCREELQATDTANRLLANMIAKKQVRCPNADSGAAADAEDHCRKKAKPLTCEWTGPCSEMHAHRTTCAEETIACGNGCEEEHRRKDMPAHLAETCPRRLVTCSHCAGPFRAEALPEHEKRCPKRVFLCSRGCGARLPLEQLSGSHKVSCPRELVACPFARFGCKAVVARCELERHQAEESSQHALLSLNKVDGLEKQLASAERTIASLPKVETVDALEKRLSSLQRLVEKKFGPVEEEALRPTGPFDDILNSFFRPPVVQRQLVSPHTTSRPEVERKFDDLEREIGRVESSVSKSITKLEGAVSRSIDKLTGKIDKLDRPSQTVFWNIEAAALEADCLDLRSQVCSCHAWTRSCRSPSHADPRLDSQCAPVGQEEIYLSLESKSKTGKVHAYLSPGSKVSWFPIRIGGSEIRVRSWTSRLAS